ncbi:MAG: GNAT family N-acetyltransferase [Streptosporangiaceae bacterium]
MTAARPAAPGAITAGELTVVPANEASWADLQAIFGTAGYIGSCSCQYFKIRDRDWHATPDSARRDRFLEQTQCGDPGARATTGLVGYLGTEPVAWVAVEPRTAYARLPWVRTVWHGRDEDKADGGVWAVTCFVTRTGHRKRGITYALAVATIDFARQRGARALEAYPMIVRPGEEVSWGELYVGSRQVFAEAGFTEVSRPSPRRVVMRIDFG